MPLQVCPGFHDQYTVCRKDFRRPRQEQCRSQKSLKMSQCGHWSQHSLHSLQLVEIFDRQKLVYLQDHFHRIRESDPYQILDFLAYRLVLEEGCIPHRLMMLK